MNPRNLFLAAAAAWLIPAALLADPGDVSPAPPVIPAGAFSLANFGAIGDGKAVETKAFVAAIAAVRAAGGGTLTVPAGTYLTGPIQLCDGLNLHLAAGATIQFSPKSADYHFGVPGGSAQISVSSRHDVMISGSGRIDGHGAAWWPAARAMRDPVTGRQTNGTTTRRPPMLVFVRCQRVRVEGVTLQNSPGLNLGLNDCQDATIDGITILNPADSPNTDGIDPKGAQRVLIAHCHIDTGDDCIAAGGSRSMLEHDILITDCTFLRGHGCSIGSGTAGGVRDFTVRRCTFDGTDTGIRLKSARGRGGLVENLLYEDLAMVNVGRAISLNSHYEGTTTDLSGIGHVAAELITPQTPQWRHIVVRNLRSTAGGMDAGLILGLPEMPAQDILLEHVTIEAPKGLQVAYTQGITLRDVHIKTDFGPSLLVADTVTNLTPPVP
jgi:polygalacturonase